MAGTTKRMSTARRGGDKNQEDIGTLCSAVCDLVDNPDKNLECCVLMRQLLVVLQSSDDKKQCCSAISTLLQTASSHPQGKVLNGVSKYILSRMLLSEILVFVIHDEMVQKFLSIEERHQGALCPFLLQGGDTVYLRKALQDLRWLASQDSDQQKLGLVLMAAAAARHKELIDSDIAGQVSQYLAQWLNSTGQRPAANSHQLNPFRKDEEGEVLEVDGTPSTNAFTALNIVSGQQYTDSQFMNILSFSVLLKWLKFVSQRCQVPCRLLSQVVSPSGCQEFNPLVMDISNLVARSISYCFRIIDQCDRKAKTPADGDLQSACLSEAVQVLDVICSLDKNQTANVFHEIKRLNSKLMQEAEHVPVVVHVLKFFFHHSTSVAHDPDHTVKHYFTQAVSQNYKDQGFAYDTVEFLLDNLMQVAETTDVLTGYFPNIFKMLAWHPQSFVREFSSLLPFMMNSNTTTELFHLLLDLPCLTAALEVMERASRSSQPSTMAAFDSEPATSLEAFHHPRFKPLFSYMARCESGHGDTIDRLSNLHLVLRDCVNSFRVITCCQIVPVLLKVWFETLLTVEDPSFVSQLLPVIMERSGLLLSVPELIQDVHKVLAENLLLICRKFPDVISRQQTELCDFLQSMTNVTVRMGIYYNMIYAVGEYCSEAYCPDCNSKVIAKYYEVLEVVTYEALGMLGGTEIDPNIPRVLSSLTSAVAKLASRCQDLIPRAILCLAKVAKQPNLTVLSPVVKDFLTNKVASLIALLQNSDSAWQVFTANLDSHFSKSHLSSTSHGSILRGLYKLTTGPVENTANFKNSQELQVPMSKLD